MQALAEQAAIAIHNARLFRRQEMQNQRLVTLAEVSRAISASLDAEDVLERVCSAVGAFFFEAPTEAEVWLRSGRGFAPFRTQLGGGEATPRIPDKLVAQMIKKRAAVQNGAGRRGRRLVVPLIVNRFIEGYLDVRCRRRSRLTDDEMQVVEILVGHAAVALENAQNYGKLESMYLETVRALAAAIEAKDHYTAEHGDMLANMAIAVGRRLGLDDDALRDVQYAAVLHDIGKIGIPGHILNKPDKLTDEEFAVMAEHTIIGERIIRHIDYLAPIASIIRSAHERWDGRGYPDKPAGEEIPLGSRILLVCDAYPRHDVRPALSPGDARGRGARRAAPQRRLAVRPRRSSDAFLEAWPHFDGGDLAAGVAAGRGRSSTRPRRLRRPDSRGRLRRSHWSAPTPSRGPHACAADAAGAQSRGHRPEEAPMDASALWRDIVDELETQGIRARVVPAERLRGRDGAGSTKRWPAPTSRGRRGANRRRLLVRPARRVSGRAW